MRVRGFPTRTVTLADPRVTVPSFSRTWLAPSYTTAEPGEAEALGADDAAGANYTGQAVVDSYYNF